MGKYNLKQEKTIWIFMKNKHLLLIVMLLCISQMGAMEQPTINIKNIDDKSLDTLYQIHAGEALYIPLKDLVETNGDSTKLKELFKKNNLCLGWPEISWNHEEKWKQIYSKLMKRTENIDDPFMIPLDEIPRLLINAKSILKSFLITDDKDLNIPYQDNFIKKTGLNRLFTYARLDRVIKEKNLTNVRLPRKVLVIQNRKTGEYISSKKAPEIIDTILKLCISPFNGDVVINYDDTTYELRIFAQKEKNDGDFNITAWNQLVTLCKEAPFDIGYGNIFADDKGNAIIIDTEFKGEPTEDACPKLQRYTIDYKK